MHYAKSLIISLIILSSSIFAGVQGYVAQILSTNTASGDIMFKLDNASIPGAYAASNTTTNPTNKYLLIKSDSKNLYALLLWATTNHVKINVELGSNNGNNTYVEYIYVVNSIGL